MNTPTKRARLIEIQLPVGAPAGAELSWPDQPDLRGCYVTAVETFFISDITAGPSGTVAVDGTDQAAIFVTVVENSTEKVKLIPYSSFNRLLMGGIIRYFRDLRPTFEQCSLRIATTLVNPAVQSALILVHYEYESDRRGA